MSDKNFYSEYMVLNSGTEIPPMFTAWCSLAAVSCLVARRVHIDMGPFKIYPNHFIVLIAGSGAVRKSTALNVTRDMIEELTPKPNIIGQKNSPEALIDALKITGPVNSTIINGEAIGQGFIFTDEITNFLGRASMDNGIVPLLIEFFDCRNRFIYRTKSRGVETLVSTQLGMLAATTPEELRKAIPEEMIGSGLASRILFIYEAVPAPPNYRPMYSARQIEAKEFCVRALRRFSTISGEIKLSDAAWSWCKKCYNERCYNTKFHDDPHLRGYASRRYIHILKIAINLTVGLYENLDITPDTLQRSENLLLANEEKLSYVMQLVTMNEKGGLINFVLQLIIKHKQIRRQDLLRLVSHRMDANELTIVMETLIRSEQVTPIPSGTEIIYGIPKQKGT